jgi:hypothetical protein
VTEINRLDGKMTRAFRLTWRMDIVRTCIAVAFSIIVLISPLCVADESKTDSRYPFRTDFANANLPWYQPKPHEFPPHHSDRRISGELVTLDFIHRIGQFRTSKSGELVDFTMPPYGNMMYLNAEADLRDMPLGTYCLFFLNQDSPGNFTRLATLRDEYSIDAGHSFSYRLDEIRLSEGKLLTIKQSIAKRQPDLGKRELLVSDQTRVWKGDKQLKLSDLVVGDDLLFNLTGKSGESPGRCTDIWVGADTHKLVTEQHRKKFAEFIKKRGIPGWIDQTDGNKLTITLFSGDPNTFKETWLGEFEIGKELRTVVANEELRMWNPPVDNERSNLLEIQKGPIDSYGTSGVRLVVTVADMLEGFRKGRVVRIFAGGWPLKDPPYGESLMSYGYSAARDPELLELTPKEYPAQFPFRTDYGNENLPWYQLKADMVPPRFSDHVVLGELVKVDPAKRAGQFRADRTGALVDFSLLPQGSAPALNTVKPNRSSHAPHEDQPALVRYLNADAELADLPLGIRCRFQLYQDESGAFTKASLVTDEFSYLAQNAVVYRIEAVKLDEGRIYVARQIPEMKNYNGDMIQPPDIGRTELRISAGTRIWKGSELIKAGDLAVGNLLLVNVTGEQPGAPSYCTDVWVGVETQELVSERQRKLHHVTKK